MEYCRRCMLTEPEENRILSELAYSRERSIQDLLNQMRYGMHSLKERASESMKERIERGKRELAEYEERLKQHEEDLSYQIMDRALQGENIEELVERITKDKLRQELEQQVKSLKYQPEGLGYEDVEQSLEEYAQQGYIDIERGKIKITPKGARKLANNVLRRILENLTNKEMGPHAIKEIGYGSELSTTSRKYEIGDEYELVDIQRTLLNALERNPEGKRISLKQGDFQVYETQHMTKMCAGLIIDESGSMRVGKEDKINAAIDTSLALSELIKREPKDKLKVFLFSEQVREIPYYDILNISFPGGYTDIRQAMEAFRRCVR
ncbi:MAG: hypothetical protein QMD14_03735, partial [Candidatus Aenigmarchaeota archaeon]|nr:hypothetical protein [Candidatus Aenigmarchaeota archaeon]